MIPTLTPKQICNLEKIQSEFEIWFVYLHIHKLDLDNLEGCLEVLETLANDLLNIGTDQ